MGRALAAQGFVVVVPDYRLVPEVRFPAFLEDSAAAVRWARDNAAAFGGDGQRITLVGHSAGAYNAAMLALDPRWLGPDRAAVRGFVTLAGPFDFLPLDDPATIAAFGSLAAAGGDPAGLSRQRRRSARAPAARRCRRPGRAPQQRGPEGAARRGGRAARAHRLSRPRPHRRPHRAGAPAAPSSARARRHRRLRQSAKLIEVSPELDAYVALLLPGTRSLIHSTLVPVLPAENGVTSTIEQTFHGGVGRFQAEQREHTPLMCRAPLGWRGSRG